MALKQQQQEAAEEVAEPVSPTGQYFTSSAISVSVIAVLESEIPIDDSHTMKLLNDVFLPINPRFSSIMVKDKNGIKRWKKVDVKLQDHVNIPIFSPQPQGGRRRTNNSSTEFYEACFAEYLSKLAMEQLPQSRPLWEIHIVKYPTTTAAGSLVFKLHHALGDGYSLMGALLSCLQRADNPEIPLTFPIPNSDREREREVAECHDNSNNHHHNHNNVICRNLPKAVSGVFNTIKDFGWSLLKSTLLEDDRSPIRSGDDGVEFRPISIFTVTFSIDQIKQIKANVAATINDVICGVVFLGIRLYMRGMNQSQNLWGAKSTALVLLNTRNIAGYKSVSEMVKPGAESPWGNQFAFLHVPVPDVDPIAPLTFVLKAQDMIKRKRNSTAVILTGKLLDALSKLRGPETTAQYIHSTLKNTSMTVSNMLGPLERMALSNHPIKGLYFMVAGVPQNLTITMVSYMGDLRLAVGAEKELIDAPNFKACLQNAFNMIYKAAVTDKI
ncbi:wax ester synthase/diacylglycerol acyltransferase 4-like [Andrographis paniculata]|uniref:wax ester synthase/diacylglycerol acyltransferase 4-like n=1 Tax=Andrographis paniculata TaxID=175694 RepID=UPI0021E96BE6|nr:wax ester synthase/diacylglycerol acyltransferase 4-like [Andrographis paniculata]